MTRIGALFAFLLALTTHSVLANESICLNREPLPEGADDFRMQEYEFSLERGLKSVSFLQNDFSKRIWGPEAVNDFSAWSGHYIGYANSLKLIEGTLLKQQVMIGRLRLKELTNVSPDSGEIDKARTNLERLMKQFCKFLDSSGYVD